MASGYNTEPGIFKKSVHVKSTNIDQNSSPAEVSYGVGFVLRDTNNKRISQLTPLQSTSGKIATQLYSVREVNGSEVFNGLQFGIKSDGTLEDSFVSSDSYTAFLNMLDSGWENVSAGADLDSGTLLYRRFGRIVILEGQTVKMKSSVGAGNRGTAGTLPSGFRPSRTAYGEAVYGHISDLVEIGTNGTILVQLPTNWTPGTGCWFTIVFFTD